MSVRLYNRFVCSDQELDFHRSSSTCDLEIVSGDVRPEGAVVHDVADPGGEGRLEVRSGENFQIAYDGWRFECDGRLIRYCGEGDHRSPFDLVIERVVVPLNELLCGLAACAFHGSGVIWEERAIVFVGESGAGKSTTARLLRSVAEFACDDLALITTDQKLAPGASGVRSFDSLEGDGRALYPGSSKRWFRFAEAPPEPAELRLIVSLSRGTEWSVSPVEGARKAVVLLRHSFDLESPPAAFSASRLQAVSEIARTTPVVEITYPANSGEPAHTTRLWDELRTWI